MTTANIHSQKILILDFGSQYTQLIARRVRELGVYCEIWDYAVDEQLFREFDPQGVIFSGSPESANHDESPRPPEFIYDCRQADTWYLLWHANHGRALLGQSRSLE